MDEEQAGALIMSCLEQPVERLLEFTVCFLVAIDEVVFFSISGGALGGWVAVAAGDPLVLILKLPNGYIRRSDSKEQSRVFAKGVVWCCC